jgi:hypothetical protein
MSLSNPVFKQAEHESQADFLKRQERFIKKKENKFISAGSMVENAADASLRKLQNTKEGDE